MIFEDKLVKIVENKIDLDLATTEYKVSVYDEIETYLSENNCSEGIYLVNKRKLEMSAYVEGIKNDLAELEEICNNIEVALKNLNKENDRYQSIININSKKVYISKINDNYSFIYLIGYDYYTKLYKYGIIEAEVYKDKLRKIKKKIGFAHEDNLVDYTDFKVYFNESLRKFNEAGNLGDLDFIRDKINKDLAELFNTESLEKYLVVNSEHIKKLTDISGYEIFSKLYENYDLNRVKIRLILAGYSTDNVKFIDLVRTKIHCNNVLDYLKDQKENNDFYRITFEKDNEKINFLLKELNMSLAELEIAVDKLNCKNE
ncbi:hypothetical protein [Clostridium manihotivorum]|uniref:Uncharacterized protein n=1 Tax=Clostridium manihotivorum TaxID=2320868 RepID=A0A410DWM9_9CLOT|nr:hypothetical protein [Clostridium manihotivorum]QAA33566.1 hypothetical protein C1I91_19045 [Clostridium manihotivorum]